MKFILSFIFLLTFSQAVITLDYRMDECYWLDGTSGIIDDVQDNTANELDGTSHGNASIFNVALSGGNTACSGGRFDGNADYIDVSNNALLTTGNNFSISTWVYLNDTSNTFEIIAHKTTNYRNGFTLYVYRSGSSNYIMFLIGDGSHQGYPYYRINELEWVHIVATYDGSRIRLYFNGVQVSSRSFNYGIANVNVPFVIGKGTGSNYSFNGDVDEMKLYNHTLSPVEITTIYNNENAGNNHDGTSRTCPTCTTSTTAGQFSLIGIPADLRTTPNKDVADVFDEFPGASYNVAGLVDGWRVFKRIYDPVTNASSYNVVPYTGEALQFGQGYWIQPKASVTWSENTLKGVDYNITNPACVTTRCVEIDLTPVNKNFGAPDNDVNDHSGKNRNNMLGFVGHVPVNWADCRILVDGTVYTPSAADSAGYIDKQIWQYNPGVGGADANGYTTCDDTTPGGCKLEPYKGFWVILHGKTKNKTVKLLIPKE